MPSAADSQPPEKHPDCGEAGRHWRASAWLLERKDPQEFAPRGPDIITGQQLHELLTQIVRILVEAIPVASIRKNVIKQLSLLLHALGRPVHEKGKPQ